MRKGANPAKQNVPAYNPEKLAVLSMLYIPVEGGYYASSWEVFLAHLASVHQYTGEPINYVLFDNGSCPAVRQRLQKLHEEGWIDWLVLSQQNLGKTGALNWLLGALPNEWLCYADSDMLFRNGWLEACWLIEKSFPNLGMIGAQVIFPDWDIDKGNTSFRQTHDAHYAFSQVKPEDWILDEYCRGRGIDGERRQLYTQMLLDQVQNRETGVAACLGGNSHQQWLARREIICQILPLPASLQLSRKEDTYQDHKLDELGYLHLTTTIPYLYHMGNSIDEELKEEVGRLEIPGSSQVQPAQRLANKSGRKNNLFWRLLVWLSSRKSTRNMLLRLYNNLYEIFSS